MITIFDGYCWFCQCSFGFLLRGAGSLREPTSPPLPLVLQQQGVESRTQETCRQSCPFAAVPTCVLDRPRGSRSGSQSLSQFKALQSEMD
jgi:hypothetical protein